MSDIRHTLYGGEVLNSNAFQVATTPIQLGLRAERIPDFTVDSGVSNSPAWEFSILVGPAFTHSLSKTLALKTEFLATGSPVGDSTGIGCRLTSGLVFSQLFGFLTPEFILTVATRLGTIRSKRDFRLQIFSGFLFGIGVGTI